MLALVNLDQLCRPYLNIFPAKSRFSVVVGCFCWDNWVWLVVASLTNHCEKNTLRSAFFTYHAPAIGSWFLTSGHVTHKAENQVSLHNARQRYHDYSCQIWHCRRAQILRVPVHAPNSSLSLEDPPHFVAIRSSRLTLALFLFTSFMQNIFL